MIPPSLLVHPSLPSTPSLPPSLPHSLPHSLTHSLPSFLHYSLPPCKQHDELMSIMMSVFCEIISKLQSLFSRKYSCTYYCMNTHSLTLSRLIQLSNVSVMVLLLFVSCSTKHCSTYHALLPHPPTAVAMETVLP